MGQFYHQPLELGTRTVRLLRLRENRADTVACDLIDAPLGEDHVCLSYMWGRDAPSHKIYINDKVLKVRENLFHFLQTAQKLNICDWLWIDALCIDQKNVEERNHQVQHMGEIYQQAKHVLIYAGRISWSSTFLYESFRREESSQSRHPAPGSLMRSFRGLMRQNSQSPMFQPQLYPYWNRLWIVQELALAKQRYVVTDSRLLSWKEFEYATSAHGPYDVDHANSPMVWKVCQPGKRSRTRYLEQLITMFESSECEDIRDHVYGLMGYAIPKPAFSVDYGIDTKSLFIAVVNDYNQRGIGQEMSEVVFPLKRVAQVLQVEIAYVCWTCFDFMPPPTSSQRAKTRAYKDAAAAGMPSSMTTLWVLGENQKPNTLAPHRCSLCTLEYREVRENFTLTDIRTINGCGQVQPRILFHWTRPDYKERMERLRHSPRAYVSSGNSRFSNKQARGFGHR